MFDFLFGIEAQRKRLLKKGVDGALQDYLSAPFPDKNTPFSALDIVSVDFETTGLNAIDDKLLSVGHVSIEYGIIKLNSCFHQVVRSKGALDADNVSIHQITDSQKDAGAHIKTAVDELLSALKGKVMLVHFARIEKQFLQQACKLIYGFVPPLAIIDTLALAKRKLEMRDVAYDPSQLRLGNLRQQYHLPDHFAHNALNDAIATAELLLAMVNEMPEGIETPLGKLLL
ncbi:exonuclease domain-containing protein [Thalassotalea agarivorans]|uniref:DNA polymerase-3 subunit epsilon n=1 Tax=Thalassotalea agarivorans TaxID=349064 RepID=A0A1I0CKS6_THASX|nr:exonuclease domain-containing protein [Thalassotalea agarivorans]SET20220.1 DNA polymerase-3 subunit epsilon [Thalassotalea agarivorans]